MSGQKLIKNAKNRPFWRVFDKPEVCRQTVLPDKSILMVENWWKMPKLKLKIEKKMRKKNVKKIQVRHFWMIFKHCVFIFHTDNKCIQMEIR